MNATLRQSLRRLIPGFAVLCLVLTWAGCKSVSPYDQLEIEKKKNEEREMEREHKGWEINR